MLAATHGRLGSTVDGHLGGIARVFARCPAPDARVRPRRPPRRHLHPAAPVGLRPARPPPRRPARPLLLRTSRRAKNAGWRTRRRHVVDHHESRSPGGGALARLPAEPGGAARADRPVRGDGSQRCARPPGIAPRERAARMRVSSPSRGSTRSRRRPRASCPCRTTASSARPWCTSPMPSTARRRARSGRGAATRASRPPVERRSRS